jgi:DNA-binding MarR family transcriptional regulator
MNDMARAPLGESTGHLLARTCKGLRVHAHASLERIGLYRGQQFALRALWQQEGLTHSELAEWLNVSPATITNMLKRMERAGLVERRRDTEDERVSHVYLTEGGRDIQGAVERTWRELEKQTFAGFSLEELDLLGQFLLRIQENWRADANQNRPEEDNQDQGCNHCDV